MDDEVQQWLDSLDNPKVTPERQSQSREYIAAVIAFVAWVDWRLRRLSGAIDREVPNYIDSNGNVDSTGLYKVVGEALDEFFEQYTGKLEDTAKLVVAAKMKVEVSRLKKANISKLEVERFSEAFAQYVDDVPVRFKSYRWSDGKNYTQRIKTLKDGTEKVVLSIIENGVNEGKGAKAIAKDIRQYVAPVADSKNVAPREVYRKRFNRATNYIPKNVPTGSVQYNAVRIARTETARLYRESALQFYKNKKWVKGYRWVLSNSHGRADECDAYAAEEWQNVGDIPTAHPNCLCDVQPILNEEKV